MMIAKQDAMVGTTQGAEMSKDLFDKLNGNVGCNTPAQEAQIKAANLKLKQLRLPQLPEEFVALLKCANGFSNDDVRIYGAEIINDSWYDDVVRINKQLFHENSANWLLLGRDDYFYLIYIPSVSSYQLVDQDTLQPEISSETLEEPLLSILRV